MASSLQKGTTSHSGISHLHFSLYPQYIFDRVNIDESNCLDVCGIHSQTKMNLNLLNYWSCNSPTCCETCFALLNVDFTYPENTNTKQTKTKTPNVHSQLTHHGIVVFERIAVVSIHNITERGRDIF